MSENNPRINEMDVLVSNAISDIFEKILGHDPSYCIITAITSNVSFLMLFHEA